MSKSEKERKSLTWSEIGTAAKNSIQAIFKGEFLLRLGVDKYFIHIIYTFLLIWLSIYMSMKIDATLTTVERNRATLKDLEIYHAEKTNELVRLNRFSSVEKNLEQLGSDVAIPQKPATIIKKK